MGEAAGGAPGEEGQSGGAGSAHEIGGEDGVAVEVEVAGEVGAESADAGEAGESERGWPAHSVDTAGVVAVGQCKLDPSLKAICFQHLNLRVNTVLSA